jgi:hypothetical protein
VVSIGGMDTAKETLATALPCAGKTSPSARG